MQSTKSKRIINLEKRDNTYCCVPQCNSRGSRNPCISFHKFPRIKSVVVKTTTDGQKSLINRRQEWIRILRIKKSVTSRMSVCSKHFRVQDYIFPPNKVERPRLKPTALPSLFLPKFVINNPEKIHFEDKLSVAMSYQQEYRENESGRKKPQCHLCSQEFLNFTDVLEHLKTKHTIWFRNRELINCSIPGCESKSQRLIDYSSAEGEGSILMFPVPHADGLFNKWKEALKDTSIELTKDDHICERHFLENDIEKYFRTKTPDGDIIEIKKKLPTLKPKAIPIKFLMSSHLISKDATKKSTAVENSVVIKPKQRSTDNLTSNSCNSEDTSVHKEVEVLYEASTDDLSIPRDSLDNSLQEEILHKKNCLPYNELVKNIQLVKAPSKFWSVVCTDQFTIFAKWNKKFIAEKRLVIESPLTIRVFLNDWEIEMTDLMDITSVDDITKLLGKVESYNMASHMPTMI